MSEALILCANAQHGAAINHIALKMAPVVFTTPDGVRHVANSVWAATGYLFDNGWYKQTRPVIWDIESLLVAPVGEAGP